MMTDAARQRRVDEVCDAALDRKAAERAAFVAAACGNDHALREEVEALLAHAETAESFLAEPMGVAATQVLCEETALLGRQISSYRILAHLGAGGMGEVYRARDTKLGRDVAIKVLPNVFVSDPDRLARFEREARLLATLNHPHIGAIYGLDDTTDVRALVLELVEGPTLADRLSVGPLPVQEAVTIAHQIVEALEAAHAKGIIHRDLKPANIKVTSGGVVKVLDFGLAKANAGNGATPDLSELPSVTLDGTRDGVILGTAGYMSPEQARGHAVDPRADIFAFGAILYEMLSGRRAFSGATTMDALTAVLKDDPPGLAAARHIPPALARIVDRCLKKNAAARFQTASDLAFALECVPSPSESVAARTDTHGNRSLLQHAPVAWGVAIGSVLVAALAIGTMFYVQPAGPEPVVTRLDVITPPTLEPASFALSPDGRHLVFVATADGVSKLWLRPLDQSSVPLMGTEGAMAPFWAPDAHAVGFFADGKLKRLDLNGGLPRVLAEAPLGRGGAWSREGVIVFAPTTTGALMRLPAAGGGVTPVTQLEQTGHQSHRWPQFLPDGRRFVFLATNGPQPSTAYLGSIDGSAPMRLLATTTAAAYAPPGYLLAVEQGLLMARSVDLNDGSVGDPVPLARSVGSDENVFVGAFSTSLSGVLAYRITVAAQRQLVWVTRTGAQIGNVRGPDDSNLLNPALAPDTRRVALQRTIEGNADTWVVDSGRDVSIRLTFDPANDNAPVWSPDGRLLVYRSNRNGPFDLYAKSANGSGTEEALLVNAQLKLPLDWSADGRVILYQVLDPNTGFDIWALPVMGERKPFPFVATRFNERNGQFSPDGRWVAYDSNESGRSEVYVQPFPMPSGKWQISSVGGMSPRWRRDGREIFYVAPDGAVVGVPMDTSDDKALAPGAATRLFRLPIVFGGSVATGGAVRHQYDVAPDGQRFLLNVVIDEPAAPITIMQNWTTLFGGAGTGIRQN